jgi:hypothetical protein
MIKQLQKYQRELLLLIAFGIIPFISKMLIKNIPTQQISSQLGKILMSLPRPVMMILMAIPEQAVMATMEPSMPIQKRLLVSIAMYIIHFAWNGLVMKPEKSYNELVWILGTAFYALQALKVKRSTAIALIAADSIMTLSLRGLA